jgi:hypothetical protein
LQLTSNLENFCGHIVGIRELGAETILLSQGVGILMVIEFNLSSIKEGLEAIVSKKAPLMRIQRLLFLFRKFLLLRGMRGGKRGCVTLVMLNGVEVMFVMLLSCF